MPAPRLAPILAILALLLAGCLGGATEPAEPRAASATAEALAALDAEEGGPPAPPEPVPVPLRLDGRYPIGILVCPPAAGDCQGTDIEPPNDRLQMTDLQGRIRSLELSVTWDAATPAMERLQVVVETRWNDCPECKNKLLAMTEGRSPIIVDVPALDVPIGAGGILKVHVRPLALAHDPAYLRLTHEQEFTLEGALMLQPDVN